MKIKPWKLIIIIMPLIVTSIFIGIILNEKFTPNYPRGFPEISENIRSCYTVIDAIKSKSISEEEIKNIIRDTIRELGPQMDWTGREIRTSTAGDLLLIEVQGDFGDSYTDFVDSLESTDKIFIEDDGVRIRCGSK